MNPLEDPNVPETPELDQQAQPQVEQPSASFQEDPSVVQLARMQQELQQYQQAFTQLSPYAKQIEKLVTDPEAAQFFEQAYQSYETVKQQQKPQLDPALQELDKKVTSLVDYVTQQQQAAQMQAQAAAQEAFQRDYAYAERLVSQHPELQQQNFRAIRTLKAWAQEDGLNLEQAFKKYGKAFVNTDVAGTPPSSLRADSGEIGIPQAGQATADTNGQSFRDMLLNRLKKSS